MKHVEPMLDRPIWSALTTEHAHFALAHAVALRYRPDIVPFAALAHQSEAAYAALGDLLHPGEEVGLLSDTPAEALGIQGASSAGVIDQMVFSHAIDTDVGDDDVVRLDRNDVGDMLALTEQTKPGPFGVRTYETGNYVGIRFEGRLVAMAGERMRFGKYVEISSVCVDDSWRGRGLAGTLVKTLVRQIQARGAIPFLHVYSDKRAAIVLYERLGFEKRRSFFVVHFRKA